MNDEQLLSVLEEDEQYRSLDCVVLTRESFTRWNKKNPQRKTYELLPAYGQTRFISGIICPEPKSILAHAQQIQEIGLPNVHQLQSTTQTHDLAAHIFYHLLEEDIRHKTQNVFGTALIQYKPWSHGNVMDFGMNLEVYKGVPVR